MIPKTIHYCWFGHGEMSKKTLKYIDSWKRHLPGYEIKEWNENTFDINSNLFVQEAYHCKKYAFVSDYVRLYALYNEGGIYLDTDVELLKSFDKFLNNPAFIGFESNKWVASAIIGAEKNNSLIKELLDYYTGRRFFNPDDPKKIVANTVFITEHLVAKNLRLENKYQVLDKIKVFPTEFFSPKDDDTGKIHLTENSHCIHHFSKTWIPKRIVILYDIKKALIAVFGENFINTFIRIFRLKQLKKILNID